jgi:acetyl-CoA carboxylase biotin carboxyl carrier protein
MVGTFYRAPSPKDPPFVDIGSVVKVGDPLCVIEVMKLFTTIEADRAGRVSTIYVSNAELVEFNQPLFRIE